MGSMRLTLLRHGHAEAPHDEARDFDRPLTRRGLDEAAGAGAWLAARRWVPDRIIASPAVRTATTAQRVAEAFGIHIGEIEYRPELYSATPATIWQVAAASSAGSGHVLICGHNPAISELAGRFGPQPVRRSLVPAGLVSASWPRGDWDKVLPEDADACESREP